MFGLRKKESEPEYWLKRARLIDPTARLVEPSERHRYVIAIDGVRMSLEGAREYMGARRQRRRLVKGRT